MTRDAVNGPRSPLWAVQSRSCSFESCFDSLASVRPQGESSHGCTGSLISTTTNAPWQRDDRRTAALSYASSASFPAAAWPASPGGPATSVLGYGRGSDTVRQVRILCVPTSAGVVGVEGVVVQPGRLLQEPCVAAGKRVLRTAVRREHRRGVVVEARRIRR